MKRSITVIYKTKRRRHVWQEWTKMKKDIKKMKIIVAVTGASGSIYAQVLLDRLAQLQDQVVQVGVILSDNAKDVWQYELKNTSYRDYQFDLYDKSDFFSPAASGSAAFDVMIICPCSMGTLGRIAGGISDDLITRSADVVLKERKKLIMVVRESPFNHIHLSNMLRISEAGGIICPANPSFYSHPQSFEQLAATVTDRALQLAGLDFNTYRWGDHNEGV